MVKVELIAIACCLLICADMVFAPPGGGRGKGRDDYNDQGGKGNKGNNGRGNGRGRDDYADDTTTPAKKQGKKDYEDPRQGGHGRLPFLPPPPPPSRNKGNGRGSESDDDDNDRKTSTIATTKDSDDQQTTVAEDSQDVTLPPLVDTVNDIVDKVVDQTGNGNKPSRKKTSKPNKDEAMAKAKRQDARSLLGLTASSSETIVEADDEVTLSDGGKMKRAEHRINNIPVWNSGATILRRNSASGVRGMMITSTNNPDSNMVIQFTRGLGLTRALPIATDSEKACKKYYERQARGFSVNATSKRFVYSYGTNSSDPNDVVYADLVSIRGLSTNGTMLAYHCLVDTKKQAVMQTWNGLQGSWDGGNLKTGKYTYGSGSKPALSGNVTKTSTTSCKMTNSDNTIQVFHMNFGSGELTSSKTPYSFTCTAGPTDADSRSYGVISDSFFNALKATEMYKNSDWGGLTKVTSTGTLKFAVHYQRSYDNAYWDGYALYFGDGGSWFYPLGTCLDVVAHEMGHAVTDANSALIYSGESGCLNEAFSDAMGEMTEYYYTNTNDWCIAKYCMASGTCLRDMTKYAQYSQYFPYCSAGGTSCQDPHSCSAVPNYIFYKLATSRGWNTKLEGKAWMLANRLYWRQGTGLRQAGCDVASAVKQASIVGGDTYAVINAWKAGGIDISSCVSYPSSGTSGGTTPTPSVTTTRAPTTTTKPPGTTASNPIKITNCDSVYGQSGATGSNRYYMVYAPYGSTAQNIQIYGNNGDADLYVRAGQAPTLSTYDSAPFWTGSDEWVVEDITKSGVNYYIMVNAAEAYTNLEVYGCFY